MKSKFSRYIEIHKSIKRAGLQHLCLKGPRLMLPLIQHCPLVLTAILDFMAAFSTHRKCSARIEGKENMRNRGRKSKAIMM